jgi:hypothetical protein
MTDWKPKLGLLPQIPDRPVLMLRPSVVELAAPPLEVHNLELIADPDMLGNDKYGDCVAVAIENDRRASRAALALPLNKMSATQVVANYFAMTGGPDSGLVAQLALEWVKKNGWGTDKLLCFARVNIALTPIRQTVAEFLSGLFCVEIDTSEEYPSALWNADNSAYAGGHGIATGTYTQAYTMDKTWGYIARMTPSFVAQKVSEFDVLVWDFQWNALTYTRQVQLIADYQVLTGKTWTGPVPPAPIPEVIVLGTPIGIARIGTSTDIRGITTAGAATVSLQLGGDVVVYGETTVAGYTTDGTPRSPVWRIVAGGAEVWLLKRNSVFTPVGDVTHTVVVNVDGVAKATLTV